MTNFVLTGRKKLDSSMRSVKFVLTFLGFLCLCGTLAAVSASTRSTKRSKKKTTSTSTPAVTLTRDYSAEDFILHDGESVINSDYVKDNDTVFTSLPRLYHDNELNENIHNILNYWVNVVITSIPSSST